MTIAQNDDGPVRQPNRARSTQLAGLTYKDQQL